MSFPGIRLTGLFLMITTIIIALAGLMTRTTHVQFRSFGSPTVVGTNPDDVTTSGGETDYISVPILYPLAGVGLLAMLLWFAPAGALPSEKKTRRSRRRKLSSNKSKGRFSLNWGRTRKRRRA